MSPQVALVACVVVVAPEDVPHAVSVVIAPEEVSIAIPPEDVLHTAHEDLVPPSIALLSSCSPLPQTPSDLSLLDITSIRQAKHLSDGHGVHDVKEGGLTRSALPLDTREDSDILLIKHGNVNDAALIFFCRVETKGGLQ